MSASTSRLAYADCQEVFDTAIEDSLGIRIPFESEGAAINFRIRLHKFRQIDRDDNAQMFERTHPLYGRSNYDPVRCRILNLGGRFDPLHRQIVGGRWYIYLEPINDASHLTIERLSELPPQPPRTPRTVRIEDLETKKEMLYASLQVQPPEPTFQPNYTPQQKMRRH